MYVVNLLKSSYSLSRELNPILAEYYLCNKGTYVIELAMTQERKVCHLSSKETAQLITPPCQLPSVAQFLWKHLQRDLDVLGRALGRSVDDAALTVHLVLQQMISLNGGQTGTNLYFLNIFSWWHEHMPALLRMMRSAIFFVCHH